VKPDLVKAELQGMNLEGVNLSETDLLGAELPEVNLAGAKLSKASLGMANLLKVNLQKADLMLADLSGTGLQQANLRGAMLVEARLEGADLEKADLTDADLSYATLVQANFTDAILTGAKLYGTARDDWIIKAVRCKYVYWDSEHKSPTDRELEPGEFERLYATLPTIEYIFEKGMSPMDPLIMDRVVQAIRERRPEFDIKIDSINARGLAPSIKFTVQHEEHKELALEEVRKGYEAKIAQLEAERDRYYRLVSRALDAPKEAKLTIVEAGGIAAIDGSTVNIEPHIHNALELQKAIAGEPAESESFAKVAKKTALDIIAEATKDIAKGQVKEAAKQIIELGKELGPVIVKTAAYGFFKSMLQ
jgi:hypothetical protein